MDSTVNAVSVSYNLLVAGPIQYQVNGTSYFFQVVVLKGGKHIKYTLFLSKNICYEDVKAEIWEILRIF